MVRPCHSYGNLILQASLRRMYLARQNSSKSDCFFLFILARVPSRDYPRNVGVVGGNPAPCAVFAGICWMCGQRWDALCVTILSPLVNDFYTQIRLASAIRIVSHGTNDKVRYTPAI